MKLLIRLEGDGPRGSGRFLPDGMGPRGNGLFTRDEGGCPLGNGLRPDGGAPRGSGLLGFGLLEASGGLPSGNGLFRAVEK